MPLSGTDPIRILELRRYALRPGARDTLIELFDREFVESQEELGMRLLGQFRDLDDPDSFVWLRGFSDMETRRHGLEAFYTGPAWRANAAAANETMVDIDNVLLLRPVDGLSLEGAGRQPRGTTGSRPGLLVATVLPLSASAAPGFPAFFTSTVQPHLARAGVAVLGSYCTEHSPNTFPALPVREGEDMFVWFTSYDDEADHDRRQAALDGSTGWSSAMATAAAEWLGGEPETLRLRPTARSLLPV